MRNIIVHNVWTVSLFATLAIGYPPHCDQRLYSLPNANDCRRILNGWTGRHHPERQASHVFGIAGMERPDGSAISASQWANKIDIPVFWPQPPGRGLQFDAPWPPRLHQH